MILFQDAINLIPQAVFGGILFKVGYDVFDRLPLRLYLKELFRDPSVVLHEFFSRHDDEPIFVTNREILIIAGTTVVTVLWDLNLAVVLFTAIFYAHNKIFNKKNPMRDLKPVEETVVFIEED
jgi:SulP family sulfate permease